MRRFGDGSGSRRAAIVISDATDAPAATTTRSPLWMPCVAESTATIGPISVLAANQSYT